MKNPDPQYWTPYWKRPSITSFGDIFPENYDDSILEFWERQLDGEFSHIVDVASGNGALTWICNDILNRGARKTRITGVDFADISPFEALGKKQTDFPAVRFIGNTPAESLPFEDQSIDLVISQYGVEYTNLEESIPEIARVLIPTGRMSFILHNKESVIIQGATAPLDDFRSVLNDNALHDFALELDDLYLRIRSPEMRQKSEEHAKLVRQINASADKIRNLARNYLPRSPIHMYMIRLSEALKYARENREIDRKALIIYARDALRSQIERVEDLEVAALSAEGRRHLISLIERRGFTVTEEGTLLYNANENIGSILVARR